MACPATGWPQSFTWPTSSVVVDVVVVRTRVGLEGAPDQLTFWSGSVVP